MGCSALATLNPWSSHNCIRQLAAGDGAGAELLSYNPAFSVVGALFNEAAAYENGCSSWKVARLGLTSIAAAIVPFFGNDGVLVENGAAGSTIGAIGQQARGFLLDEAGQLGGFSIKGRLKAAGLPTSGRIRFVPPTGYRPSMPLLRGANNGFIDRFGNEWVRGPSRTSGEGFEWDVQLSRSGQQQLGWLSPDGSHLNVSLGGRITH